MVIRFDPFQNLVNISGAKPFRWKSHFNIYTTENVNGTWIGDEYQKTYGDSYVHPGDPPTACYWIWMPVDGAPHGVRISSLDIADLFSDGCDLAMRDLNAIFTIPGAMDHQNWHLDDGTTFDPISTGILVTWNCWRWFGFDETLTEDDTGYIAPDDFETLPERYYGPMGWGSFRSVNWGSYHN